MKSRNQNNTKPGWCNGSTWACGIHSESHNNSPSIAVRFRVPATPRSGMEMVKFHHILGLLLHFWFLKRWRCSIFFGAVTLALSTESVVSENWWGDSVNLGVIARPYQIQLPSIKLDADYLNSRTLYFLLINYLSSFNIQLQEINPPAHTQESQAKCRTGSINSLAC